MALVLSIKKMMMIIDRYMDKWIDDRHTDDRQMMMIDD